MNCGCKGIRTCLNCENGKKDILSFRSNTFSCSANDEYSYCYLCNCAWKDENVFTVARNHPDHNGEPLRIEGIHIIQNFITQTEENFLVENIDNISWVSSQSGRRKQDFGPKVNFKKRKVKIGNFCGFPSFVSFLINRLKAVPMLSDFVPVELCNLEYVSERGSSIDSHLDDTWLWGERLVTINLVSDTVLTLSPVLETKEEEMENVKKTSNKGCSQLIHVPLYSRSVIVLYGDARYGWYHAIFRKNVNSRRLAMTFRELSAEFLPGGAEETQGKELLGCANCYIADPANSSITERKQ